MILICNEPIQQLIPENGYGLEKAGIALITNGLHACYPILHSYVLGQHSLTNGMNNTDAYIYYSQPDIRLIILSDAKKYFLTKHSVYNTD